jgi:recombination protein RecA
METNMAGAALKLVEDKGMNKQKALETALGQIERNFGKGSIMRLGTNQAMDVEALSTGSLSLDVALGIGGLPAGRIIEIYGPESSGKTTLALHSPGRSPEARRRLRLHRRRTRARSDLRPQAGRGHR